MVSAHANRSTGGSRHGISLSKSNMHLLRPSDRVRYLSANVRYLETDLDVSACQLSAPELAHCKSRQAGRQLRKVLHTSALFESAHCCMLTLDLWEHLSGSGEALHHACVRMQASNSHYRTNELLLVNLTLTACNLICRYYVTLCKQSEYVRHKIYDHPGVTDLHNITYTLFSPLKSLFARVYATET